MQQPEFFFLSESPHSVWGKEQFSRGLAENWCPTTFLLL
jgi:hypothetical protein